MSQSRPLQLFSLEHPLAHLSTTRLQLVSSSLSVVDALAEARQLNSPGLAFQTNVGCVTVVRLTFVKK